MELINIRNDNENLSVSCRKVLEKSLVRSTVNWLKSYSEKSKRTVDLLNARLPLKSIIFYSSFADKITSFHIEKDKDLLKEFYSFFLNCSTYELLYFYCIGIDNAMCTQYELNENLIQDGHNLALDDIYVNTVLANLALVGLVIKHNLFENEILYFEYDKTTHDFVPKLRRAQTHILQTRFDLLMLVTQNELNESANKTSERHVVESIVELGVKFKQELYLKAVYGKVYPSLFSTACFENEQEVFLSGLAFNYKRKNIPINGVYIVPTDHKTIHSIFVKESLFENIRSMDCCISYKDDISSNMCIFDWRDSHNLCQGKEPVDVLKYLHTYLGTYDYGMKFRTIE